MNPASKRRMEQIRRRWWVVILVAALGVMAAAAFSLTTHATYVGKSALVLSGRTPDQDAVMIRGYLTLFNDPATIPRLRTKTTIPADVTFEALPAAASPILTIEATADDPKTAQNAATDMAEAFRADVTAVQVAGIDGHIAELERQLSQTDPFTPAGTANPYYTSLQERIETVQSFLSNQLQVLQPLVGVTANRPSIVRNVVLGAVGGLLLGILAALGLAALSTRLTNAADLRDKTGVEPLVEVPAAGSVERDRLRQDRLRTLANLVSLEDLAKPTVIALTDSRGDRGARDIAEALAELSAQQGDRTVLIYAGNDPSQPGGGAGFNDALADSGLVHAALIDGDVESLKILPAGSTLADRYSLMTRERIVAVLDELRTDADTIIVAAPSIADTTDAQLVCAAADITILVVTRGSSRAGDVISAAEVLTTAHASPWAAVLVDGTNRKDRGLHSARGHNFGAIHRTPRPSVTTNKALAESPQQPTGDRATEPIT
jgi:succinoglycan biosynthesis transport protein ExoP